MLYRPMFCSWPDETEGKPFRATVTHSTVLAEAGRSGWPVWLPNKKEDRSFTTNHIARGMLLRGTRKVFVLGPKQRGGRNTCCGSSCVARLSLCTVVGGQAGASTMWPTRSVGGYHHHLMVDDRCVRGAFASPSARQKAGGTLMEMF